MPDAIRSIFPDTVIQTCVVHVIRNAMRFVSYKDRRKIASSMRAIYSAPTLEAAELAPTEFDRDYGAQYPGAVDVWRNAWNEFIPFLDYPVELRKITKNRGHFPDKDSAMKLLYLGLHNISSERGGYSGTETYNWTVALNTLTRLFPGRIPLCESGIRRQVTSDLHEIVTGSAYVLSDRWKGPFVAARPYLLTRREIELFFTAASQIEAQSSWRWQAVAFFTLMHSCGLRTGETRALQTGQVDLDGGHIDIVWSKGNRSRRLPLTGQVIEVLNACDRTSRAHFASQRTFFVSAAGNPVTPATVGKMFGRIWDQAELTRPAAGAVRPRAQSDPFSRAHRRVEKTLPPNHSERQ